MKNFFVLCRVHASCWILFVYFKTGILTDAYTRELQKEVEEARQDDDWRENYMTLEMMMQDKYEKGWDDGRIEGKAEGETSQLILLVIRKLQKGKSVEETAKDLEEDVSVIEPIYNAVKASAPEYNVEKIYQKLVLTKAQENENHE